MIVDFDLEIPLPKLLLSGETEDRQEEYDHIRFPSRETITEVGLYLDKSESMQENMMISNSNFGKSSQRLAHKCT